MKKFLMYPYFTRQFFFRRNLLVPLYRLLLILSPPTSTIPPLSHFCLEQLILLENVESQKSVAERRLESTMSKLRDTEKALENTKKEILNMLTKEYQQRLVSFWVFIQRKVHL